MLGSASALAPPSLSFSEQQALPCRRAKGQSDLRPKLFSVGRDISRGFRVNLGMNSLQCTGTSHTSVACRPWERQSETTFVASLRGSPPEYKRRVTAFSSLAGAGSGVPGPAGDATDLQSAGAKQTSSLDDSDLDLPAKYHMHWVRSQHPATVKTVVSDITIRCSSQWSTCERCT